MKNIFRDTNTKIVGSGGNNSSKNILPRLKDKIPLVEQSHVIYKIPCCTQDYVGETKKSSWNTKRTAQIVFMERN